MLGHPRWTADTLARHTGLALPSERDRWLRLGPTRLRVQHRHSDLALQAEAVQREDEDAATGVYVQAHEFLRLYSRTGSAFVNEIGGMNRMFADLSSQKVARSIGTYVQILRSKDLITKQDVKDLVAWAGLRNSAAHGHWEQVADAKRVRLMLEGVNNFIRANTAQAA